MKTCRSFLAMVGSLFFFTWPYAHSYVIDVDSGAYGDFGRTIPLESSFDSSASILTPASDAGVWFCAGLPVGPGKVYAVATRSVWGGSGAVGYGKEWFAGKHVSWETAILARGAFYYFPSLIAHDPSAFAYGGAEGLFKANLLLFGGHVALSAFTGLHARWLQDSVLLLGAPVGVAVGVRFQRSPGWFPIVAYYLWSV